MLRGTDRVESRRWRRGRGRADLWCYGRGIIGEALLVNRQFGIYTL
jgi:hypothetical protein